MQCACTVLSSVAWLALHYVSIISHKRHDFRRTFIEYKMRLLIFSTNFVRNISHSKNNLARYDKNVLWSLCKVPIILFDFKETWIFSTDFRKIIKYQISWKSVQRELSSVRADGWTDGQTDVTKLRVPFRRFANSTKHGFFAKNTYLMYRMLWL